MLSAKFLVEIRKLWVFSAFDWLVVQLKRTTNRLITKRENAFDRFMGVRMQELILVIGTSIGANLGSLPAIVRVFIILYRFYPF